MLNIEGNQNLNFMSILFIQFFMKRLVIQHLKIFQNRQQYFLNCLILLYTLRTQLDLLPRHLEG